MFEHIVKLEVELLVEDLAHPPEEGFGVRLVDEAIAEDAEDLVSPQARNLSAVQE